MNTISTYDNDLLIHSIYTNIVNNISINLIKNFFISLKETKEDDIKIIDTHTGYIIGLEILFSISEETNILNVNQINRLIVLIKDYFLNDEQYKTIEIINTILKEKGSTAVIDSLEITNFNNIFITKFLLRIGFIEYNSIKILH